MKKKSETSKMGVIWFEKEMRADFLVLATNKNIHIKTYAHMYKSRSKVDICIICKLEFENCNYELYNRNQLVEICRNIYNMI